MIRINLLPQKKQLKRRGGGASSGADAGDGAPSQAWFAVVLGALLLEVIVLLFVYKSKQDDLKAVEKKNDESRSSIAAIQRDVADHARIKAQLKELRDREEAIQKLQAARTGPTATMLELSRILTPGRGPTVDRDKLEQLKRDNPTAVPNPNWDTRRLWLSNYNENDRQVRFSGVARDGEDVSEFLRRLALSDYFHEVRLLPASKGVDALTKLELVRFEMSAKVRY
ncbi:MAG: PilN domain-containing protein [Myxococcales bacterium]|nr:PilN domain-containing protein [Myxococcales bacterium]